jgi:hypothetical protein
MESIYLPSSTCPSVKKGDLSDSEILGFFSLYPLLFEKKVFFHSTFHFVEKRGFMKNCEIWLATYSRIRKEWVCRLGLNPSRVKSKALRLLCSLSLLSMYY